MAFNITQFTLFAVVTLYSNCITQIKEALVFPSMDSLWTFNGYYNYLAIGIPCMVMVCSEWWVHESMVLIAGTLGVDEQASQVILSNISQQIFMLPLGLGFATCTVVGNAIGEGNPRLAKRYLKMTCTAVLVILVTFSTILTLSKSTVVRLFSNEEDELSIAIMAVIPIVALKFTIDGMQTNLQGSIKSLGL